MKSPRLEPIEKPRGLLLKIAYWYSTKAFGKPIAPLKIIYSRSPGLMGVAQSLYKAEKGLAINKKLVSLIKAFVSLKNGCAFCNDLAMAMAVKEKIGKEYFLDLETFMNSSHYSPAEKSTLQYVSEILINKKTSDSTFESLKKYFNEREIVEITWVYAMEVYYNSMGLPLGLTSDRLS